MTGLATLRRASTLASAALVTAAAVLLLTAAAVAQGYPSRAVKIVVPFPAGGPLDFTARLLADKLSASAKQPFVVENRPGAAGNLGTDAVAKAAPDGYMLLLVLDTPLTVNPWLYTRLAFDPVRDFTPISTVASFSLTLVVHPSVPVNSVAEFVAYAKSRKEKPLLFGSGGGPGNPGHLAMEYFRIQAGFEGVRVPYKGNSEVVMGLVSGQIEAGFLATPGVLPNVRDGQLKAHAEAHVGDREFATAAGRFPINTPQTKEAYFYRSMFERAFPGDACARTVPGGKSIACSSPAAIAWDAAFANAADPSGRAITGVHQDALIAT